MMFTRQLIAIFDHQVVLFSLVKNKWHYSLRNGGCFAVDYDCEPR
jgi:hypothetical protein